MRQSASLKPDTSEVFSDAPDADSLTHFSNTSTLERPASFRISHTCDMFSFVMSPDSSNFPFSESHATSAVIISTIKRLSTIVFLLIRSYLTSYLCENRTCHPYHPVQPHHLPPAHSGQDGGCCRIQRSGIHSG